MLPVLLAILLWLRSRPNRLTLPEATLAAFVLTPIVLLAEILVAHVFPGERPLRVGVPTIHAIVLVVCLGWIIQHRGTLVAEGRRWRRKTARWWILAPVLWRLPPLVAAVSLAFALLHASWNAGDIHDGASYREVVAVAAYQDGRVAHIPYPYADIADAYPRTVELVYSWTMLWTHSGAGFLSVNWFALLVLGLAGAVGAQRLGLRVRTRVLAFAAIVTTPMPAYLVGVVYNDLPAAAPVAAALALMLPASRAGTCDWSRTRLWICSACLALGAASKLHAAIPAAVMCATRLAFMAFGSRRNARSGPGFIDTLAAFSLAAAVASIPYVRCWLVYGSPFWPVEFKLGSRVIFPGYFSAESLQVSTQGPWAHRWYEAIYQFFQSASQDANGAFGVLFGVLAVPAAIIGALAAIKRNRFERTFLALACFYALAIPQATNLRYCLVPLVAGYLALFRVERLAARVPPQARVGTLVIVVLLIAANTGDYVRSVVWRAGSHLADGASLWNAERNRPWLERADWIRPGVHPATYRQVQSATPGGSRLIYAVKPIPAFLHDVRYSYAVEYRPLPKNPSNEEVSAWLGSLRSPDVSGVLVYLNSPEHLAIQSEISGFRMVFEQRGVPEWRRCVYFRLEPEN